MNPAEKTLRTVRSYVLRGGRITAAQQRALLHLWPRFGCDFAPTPLDFHALYARANALTIEIGFGNGAHLLERARSEPLRNFLGIEVHRPGVGAALHGAATAELCNVRLICHDAVEVLRHQIPTASVDEIEILFPDPWHKARHHKRRLVQPELVAMAASRLRAGGSLHLATDWEPYAQQMLEVLNGCRLLENAMPAGGFAPRDEARMATRFERRGERLGHKVYELRWHRVYDASQ